MRPRSSLLPAILHPRGISLVPCLAALPSVHPFYDTYVVSLAGRANVRRVSRLLQHRHRRRRCRLRLNRRKWRCKQTMSQSYREYVLIVLRPGTEADVIVHSSPSSLVCAFCKDAGLFAPGPFREALDAQFSYTGFSYTTSWSQVQASAAEGCHWCRLLLSTRTEGMHKETLQVTVGFRVYSSYDTAPKGVQTLRLVLDDAPHSVYYASADPGAFFMLAPTRHAAFH